MREAMRKAEAEKAKRTRQWIKDWRRRVTGVDDEYRPDSDDEEQGTLDDDEDEEHRQEWEDSRKPRDWGVIQTLNTRWTDRSVRPERAQEIIRDPRPGIAIGIQNVRQRPQRQELPAAIELPERVPVTVVPGGFVNPNVQRFYYEQSFQPKFKKSWASSEMPWLFGPDGLYPSLYEECDEECMVDGVCLC